MKMIELSNNIRMPVIGYGSPIVTNYRNFFDKNKKAIDNYFNNKKQFEIDTKIKNILKKSYQLGFSLYDTSRAYGRSEECIGELIADIDRKNLFITTKISNRQQLNDTPQKSFNVSLSKLKTDYIDLCLLHWPVTNKYVNSWLELEKIYENNMCKAIGVSNFNIHHLEHLKSRCNILPMVNQIECHPFFVQKELREYCKENNIIVMAYTPTARMDDRFKNTSLKLICEKHNKTDAQIILKWHLQIGTVPIVNTMNYSHLKDNIDIFDFELTDKEVDEITSYNINSRLRYDPDNCNFMKL